MECTLERYTVDADGHPLTVWSRSSRDPQAAIVLVHGRTWSARTAFDFEPGRVSLGGSRSLLKSLAAAGCAAYAVDLRGYGATARDASGWLAPRRAVADVEAVLAFAAQRHAGLPAPVLLGWSRGAKIAALAATRAQQPLSALVLYGLAFDPDAPPLHGDPSGAPLAAANTAGSAFVSAALTADPVRVDVCCDEQFRAIRPESIEVPTLLIHGARDPLINPAAAAWFFARLASADRRWIVIGRGDHAAHLEDTAPAVAAGMAEFIRASLGAAP
jgi:alpha-beta hydrolase superfamily lysophospholipase